MFSAFTFIALYYTAHLVSGQISASDKQYTVNVLDTTGDHYYQDMRKVCYQKSDVIIICFSTVNRISFRNVKDFWLPEICKSLGKKTKPIILVGCQADLRYYGSKKYKNLITAEEGKQLAKDCGMDFYMECAAMSLVGVRDIFENVAWSVLKTRSSKLNVIKDFLKLKTLLCCNKSCH